MSPALKLALTRAMKSIAAAVADIVGPHVWGLAPDRSLLRYQAVEALNFLFQVRRYHQSHASQSHGLRRTIRWIFTFHCFSTLPTR